MTNESRDDLSKLAAMPAASTSAGCTTVLERPTSTSRDDARSYSDAPPLCGSIREVVRCGIIGVGMRGSTLIWSIVHCLRNGMQLDQYVYDAAASPEVFDFSEHSAHNRSKLIELPDFSGGHWRQTPPLALEAKQHCSKAISSLHHLDFSGGFPCLQS